MIELECIESKFNDKLNHYCSDFIDNNGKHYQICLHDYIPENKKIRINRFYHIFIEKGNFTEIIVKQKFDIKNQPEELELEIIDYYVLNKGGILTFRDTNTLDIFKMKVDKLSKEIGSIEILNLNQLKLTVSSMPHYYDKYVIENWLFNNNVIEIL